VTIKPSSAPKEHTFDSLRAARQASGRSSEVIAMAYHSSNPSDPDVYHVSDSCPTGQQIPAAKRVPGMGTGNRPCMQCAV
jgi:hypothetical protein